MINANELRIGNYLEFDGLMSIIKEIDEQGCVFDLENGDNVWIDLFQMMPIPLTEKWLLDFGFEKKSRIDIGELKPCFAIFSFAVMVRHNSYFIDWIGGNTEVKHVHQLQNLYFALTGQELTLKENK